MKKIAMLLSLFAVALVSFTPAAELPIGAEMPKADVKMKDVVSGKEVSLKEAVKQNGLLVMFSCNTCPYVVRNQQRTREVSAYALKNNIGVILVNSNAAQRNGDDSYEAMQQYAKTQKYTWYYVADDNNVLADAFGATRTPENFLFNKEGKLVYHGAIDDNPDEHEVKRKHLQTAINEMLTGKDVAVNKTRSVGCGIKRVK
jgi:thioredoxin-related protein